MYLQGFQQSLLLTGAVRFHLLRGSKIGDFLSLFSQERNLNLRDGYIWFQREDKLVNAIERNETRDSKRRKDSVKALQVYAINVRSLSITLKSCR